MLKRMVFVLVCLMMVVMPATAQSDDELLDDLAERIANLFKLDSMRITGDVVLEQELNASGVTVINIVAQEMDMQVAYEDVEFTQAAATIFQDITINSNGLDQSGTLTLDLRILPDAVFVRTYDAGGLFDGILDDEWIEIGVDPDNLFTQSLGDADALIESSVSPLLYPLDETTVTSIRQLDDVEDEDERVYTVYELVMNPQGIYDSGAYTTVLGSMDTSAFGATEEAVDEAIQLLLGDSSITLTIFIDTETDTIARVQGNVIINAEELTMMGQTVTLYQVATSDLALSDFNEPFEVTNPKDE